MTSLHSTETASAQATVALKMAQRLSCTVHVRTVGIYHRYTSVLDMNTAQDGAKVWDKIHHEGKCVKLLWSSSGAKTELI